MVPLLSLDGDVCCRYSDWDEEGARESWILGTREGRLRFGVLLMLEHMLTKVTTPTTTRIRGDRFGVYPIRER